MADKGQTAQKTEEELFNDMQKAIQSGDPAELDKLFKEEEGEVQVEEPVVTPEPEVKDETDPTPSKEPEKEEPNKQEPSPDDEFAGLDEPVRKKFEALKEERDALERKMKSEVGRVPYLQRELANTKREIEEFKRKLQEPPKKDDKSDSPAPKQGSVAQKLAQLREVDPALADILEAMQAEVINPLREDLGNEVNSLKTMFASKEQEQQWQSERSRLLERYPQADEIFKLPLYRDWKETLTPGQRALVDSGLADDMFVALEQFARYASVYHPELVGEPAQPAAATTTTTTPTKTVEERTRKLAARAPVSASTAPKFGDGLPDTEEGLHEYYKKKIRAGEM